MQSRASALWQLIGFLLLVAAAASVGAVFKPDPWYAGLAKPAWTPPNWIFAPVWLTLYVMIAVAGWLAWRNERRWPALGAWVFGLLLNMVWSWLFFDRHWIGFRCLSKVQYILQPAGLMEAGEVLCLQNLADVRDVHDPFDLSRTRSRQPINH